MSNIATPKDKRCLVMMMEKYIAKFDGVPETIVKYLVDAEIHLPSTKAVTMPTNIDVGLFLTVTNADPTIASDFEVGGRPAKFIYQQGREARAKGVARYAQDKP